MDTSVPPPTSRHSCDDELMSRSCNASDASSSSYVDDEDPTAYRRRLMSAISVSRVLDLDLDKKPGGEEGGRIISQRQYKRKIKRDLPPAYVTMERRGKGKKSGHSRVNIQVNIRFAIASSLE